MLGIDAKSVAEEARKEIAQEATKAAKDRLKVKYLSLEKARQVVRNIEREIDAEMKSIEENSIYESAGVDVRGKQ